MRLENQKQTSVVSDVESDTSGEEIPIWVRGEQRWVSGVVSETTCEDVIDVLLRDEEARVRMARDFFLLVIGMLMGCFAG